MQDLTKSKLTPLAGLDVEIGGARIREHAGYAMISLACSEAHKPELESAISGHFGLLLPEGAKLNMSGENILFSTGANQWLLAFPQNDDLRPAATVQGIVGDKIAVTDQTSANAVLAVSGDNLTAGLERICMLDLSDDALPPGSACRSLMEHMAVTILRLSSDGGYLLVGIRSQAQSLAHAVETSFRNVA